MNLKSFTPENLAEKRKLILDRLRGLDFITDLSVEDIGLDSKIAYGYSPSGKKYLKNLFLDFNITSKDSIIDIGCGKGSAMRTMLKFPFNRVDGIEFSDILSDIAIRNFKILNANWCRVFHTDASQFKDYDAYNIIYFYNPFPSCVMVAVVDELIHSIKRLDRELVIIYNNPTCHDLIVSQGIFLKMGFYPDEWGHLISIYSNRSYSNSRLSQNKDMQGIPEKPYAHLNRPGAVQV
jgi:SAM-dependent methyltransferase